MVRIIAGNTTYVHYNFLVANPLVVLKLFKKFPSISLVMSKNHKIVKISLFREITAFKI